MSGFNPFTDLGAGDEFDNLSVSFDPTSVGSFSETIDLSGIGHNASGYSAGVADTFLTLTADVSASSGGGSPLPEPPSWAMLLAGLVGRGAIARRSRGRRVLGSLSSGLP